jgi:predicted MPP superfamily phosphohydrolase
VRALAGPKAPFGIFGCLGNHEAWSRTKESIASLFERILRDACARIASAGEQLNLIGIEPDHGWGSHLIPEGLVSPDHVNILFSHYPTVFDHAAQLGVDLTLAGHTHGGQVTLDFISPRLAPALFRTPYIAGPYERNGGQLYVNRGIGTIGLPMRAGMTPEIAVFELVRQGG